MKDIKYYTPKALDLIAGMDCEILSDEGKWRKTNIANATQFGTILNLVIFLKSLRLGEVRVKYLDKDDIEDLGFKHEGSSWFYKEDCLTVSGTNGLDCRIRMWKDYEIDIWVVYSKNTDDQEIIFRGRIDNISVLNFILKIIGYEQS